MEALAAVLVTKLAIIKMVKDININRSVEILESKIIHKEGGKFGG